MSCGDARSILTCGSCRFYGTCISDDCEISKEELLRRIEIRKTHVVKEDGNGHAYFGKREE